LPEIERELDERNRMVLPKDIFEKWGNKILISPNSFAAVIYPKNSDLEHVIKSTEILLEDLRHRAEVVNDKKKKQKEER